MLPVQFWINMMFICGGRKARTVTHLSEIRRFISTTRTETHLCPRRRPLIPLPPSNVDPDPEVIRTNSGCALLKSHGVRMTYDSLSPASASDGTSRLPSAQMEYFDLARALSDPACKLRCMPRLPHVGRNIRKIFSRDILATEF